MPADESTPESDEALAARAVGGDRAAFGALVVRHERRLFRFLARAATNAADVEDAMQQAMVKAYLNLGRYDARWKFTTWLYTIALRELRSIGRRAAAGPRVGPIDDAGHVPDTGAVSAQDALAARDAGADLWAIAKRVLNPQQYTALWLRHGEDLAPREIAKVMRRPRIWVSVTLHRACAVLRQFAGEGPAGERKRRAGRKESREESRAAGGVI